MANDLVTRVKTYLKRLKTEQQQREGNKKQKPNKGGAPPPVPDDEWPPWAVVFNGSNDLTDDEQTRFKYDENFRDVQLIKDEQAGLGRRRPAAAIVSMPTEIVIGFAEHVTRLYVGSTYTEIKTWPSWRQLYDVTEDLIPVKFGDEKGTTRCEVVPCYYCGIVTPLNRIEIDHWKPQAGGGVLALLKIFRGLGLTQGPGTGARAQRITQGGIQPLPTRNNGDRPDLDVELRPKNVRIRDEPKFKLNNAGRLVLSVLYRATEQNWKPRQGGGSLFFDQFLNSFSNLVPCCGRCNKRLNHA